ncbi:MAG: acetyl-CoA carboxylase carboxyltransferase subunit beta [Candidatus Latescibacteria bacterium]|nr:acetyl-CoA carboxylase carboxyltransferase subunit beta [Candidatus Latescibacterota bacterium]
MSWLETMKKSFHIGSRGEVPGGIWVKCETCGAILLRDRLIENLWVCDKCEYHFRITPNEYVELLFDKNTFSELFASVKDIDFLRFVDTKKYYQRIKTARSSTGFNSAIITGTGKIDGHKVASGMMDFRFIGGSLSSSVGEKIVRLADYAIDKKLPVIMITQSGGARMQESTTALMQMAKASAAIGLLAEAKLPYIVILTNPTTGGVTASFAMLGDIHFAEPKALIGFAGPRVIKEAMKCELPEGFQKSQFLLEHGYCDKIVSRHHMKTEVSKVLGLLMD